MDKLDKIRKEIDLIDSQLKKLLQARAVKSAEIKGIKGELSLSIEDKTRENEILAKLDNKYQKEIYKTILSESKKIQS